jgi:hypothetical protein
VETPRRFGIFRAVCGYAPGIDKEGLMHGYDLVTVEDEKVGRICEEDGDYVIIEHGLLKAKHAVPKSFVEIDDEQKVARTTLSKRLIHDSPKVHNGDHDHQEVAAHYGLAEGYEDPMTRGYGDLLPDDPARTAEEDAVKAGVDPIGDRVATREALSEQTSQAEKPKYDSPGLTGGDRYRDAPLD